MGDRVWSLWSLINIIRFTSHQTRALTNQVDIQGRCPFEIIVWTHCVA